MLALALTAVPLATAAPCSSPASGVTSCDYNGDGVPDSVVADNGTVRAWVFGGQFDFFGVRYTEGLVWVSSGSTYVMVSATCYDTGANGDCDGAWTHVRAWNGGTGESIHVSHPPGSFTPSYLYACTYGVTGPQTCQTLVP